MVIYYVRQFFCLLVVIVTTYATYQNMWVFSIIYYYFIYLYCTHWSPFAMSGTSAGQAMCGFVAFKQILFLNKLWLALLKTYKLVSSIICVNAIKRTWLVSGMSPTLQNNGRLVQYINIQIRNGNVSLVLIACMFPFAVLLLSFTSIYSIYNNKPVQ